MSTRDTALRYLFCTVTTMSSSEQNREETGNHLFEAHHVTAVMPQDGSDHTIFHDLDWYVDAGEIVDLTGPSGAGKSTLLTSFARLNVHTTGQFLINGKDSNTFSPQAWRVQVSYVPQTSTLIGNTVADAIRLPWTLRIRQEDGQAAHEQLSDEHIRALLDSMGCEDIQLDRDPRNLSGGQAARISLARTIVTKPKVLLADEVDAGLDEENADKVAQLLQQAAAQGTGVVRIRHRAPDGRATRIMVLSNGVLSEQTLATHQTNQSVATSKASTIGATTTTASQPASSQGDTQ